MRIGLVIDSLDPRRGGVEQWTCQFIRQVAVVGHEVHVVASRFAPKLEIQGMVTHTLPPTRSRREFASRAEHVLRSLALDVTHDTGSGWYCDVFQPHGGSRRAAHEQNLLLLPPWLRGLKRGMSGWLPRYREFQHLTARQYTADPERIYLALSRMVARDMQRYHGVDEARIRLVYNGVDLARFSPLHRDAWRSEVRAQLGLDDDQVLFLIVAHNFRLKGVPTLLRAMRRLVGEGHGARLAIVGGKHVRPDSNAQEAVTWVGALDDPRPYYAAADVYVQPTWYDPCSLVVLEALASGLPVITSRYNGAGELMTEGQQGFVLDDPGSVQELSHSMRRLLDRESRQRMGLAARQLAMRHSFADNCRAILDVYQQVRAERRRAA